MRLRWRPLTFSMRNCVERLFSFLKDRAKRFYSSFPHNSTLNSVEKFVEAFVSIYNLTVPTR
ncbi:MAG: hypothetical protein ACK4TI_03885 [Nitrososphaerales archaeon]